MLDAKCNFYPLLRTAFGLQDSGSSDAGGGTQGFDSFRTES